jgi:hypothetical protein
MAACAGVLEALEFLDEVEFELDRDLGGELEGNVFVGERTSVPPGARIQVDRVGLFHPLLDTYFVAVQTYLTFNYGEFAIIKSRVVDPLPDPEKLNGVERWRVISIASCGFINGQAMATWPPTNRPTMS